MPIRNPESYPKNWKEISQHIRERSGGQCECEGECGLHSKRRCIERNGEPARYAKGKVILTVAHLNHNPGDCRNENLKAMCQKCHLRYDTSHHQKNARETRRKKRASAELFCVDKS
jgi:hypothetical protein